MKTKNLELVQILLEKINQYFKIYIILILLRMSKFIL